MTTVSSRISNVQSVSQDPFFFSDSIFDPRNMDCGEMDAADREIEQFKLFCRDSVPVQNRTKVSFDVRNIAFKKKL